MPDNTTTNPDDPTQQIIQSGLLALQQAGQQQPAQRTPIDTAATAPTTWQGRLGEWLAGGAPTEYPLTQQEREVEGRRALWNASVGLLGASGTDTIGQALAGGFLGARRQQLGSEASAADLQEAAQTWQQQQLQNRISALKEALPYLRLTTPVPNPLLDRTGGGGTLPGQAPGTQIGAIDPVAQLPKAQALDALATRESGNKNVPNAQGSDASGFWQIRDKTWQDNAAANGVDLKQYPRAMDAPYDVQRKVAGYIFDNQGAVPWAASNPNARPQTPAQPPPPAPYKTAALTPVAPPSAAVAPAGGQLPIPPIPPAGAVSSPAPQLETADDDKAATELASKTNKPVLVAGTGGMVINPDGTVDTSRMLTRPPAAATPPTATQPAQPTAEQPPVPAPQVTTQATQPPAPGGRMSFEQWQAQHPSVLALTDAERAASTVVPPDLDDLRAAQRGAAIALDRANKGLGGDPNKSLSDYNTATKAITDAQAAAAAKTAELTQKVLADKRSEARQLYDTEQARLQAPELEAQRGQQAIQLEQAKTNEAQRAKVLEGLDTDTKAAQNTIQQLQGLQELSKAAGPATVLSPDMREWLTKLNLASPEQVDQFAAQKALDAANQRLITAMRQGTGFQRTTNMDLQFLLHSTPGGAQVPPEFRDSTTAFLLNSARRTMQFNQLVQGYMSDHTTTYADAAARADKELPPIIQQMPKTYVPGSDDELKWKWDNILPGEFYKDYGPDGKPRLRIFKGDTPRPE